MASARFNRTIVVLAAVLWAAGSPAFLAAAQAGKTKAEKASPIKEEPGSWFLAGRDGACVPTSILAKKGPEYSDIQSPYQLADKLRAAGHKAEIKEFNAGSRPAVEVRAPSVELDVMFIKKQFCNKPTLPAEKK